jgi:chaperonin cofactor prefoldin
MREYQRGRRERLRRLEFLEDELVKRLEVLEKRVDALEKERGDALLRERVRVLEAWVEEVEHDGVPQ